MRKNSFLWENGVSRCPECQSINVEITESRPREKFFYRRRRCIDCEKRYTTVEIPIEKFEEYERIEQKFEDFKENFNIILKIAGGEHEHTEGTV